ncbi:MAG: response regulator [Planctomycetes bacterium]|nr:response regulator [Planctomycetota bacterium]
MTHDGNNRILIVDDNRAIHQDFRDIFGTSKSAGLDSAKAFLLGGDDTPDTSNTYDVDSALQGEEAVDLVNQAVETNRRYALAFVDVRMPPGIDGVETAERIWQVDQDIQIVICTAFSDYTWTETIKRLGETDRLLILKKPFDVVEVRQMTSALLCKWTLARQVEWQINELRRARVHTSVDYREAFPNLTPA